MGSHNFRRRGNVDCCFGCGLILDGHAHVLEYGAYKELSLVGSKSVEGQLVLSNQGVFFDFGLFFFRGD